jgi:hypothetical protein
VLDLAERAKKVFADGDTVGLLSTGISQLKYVPGNLSNIQYSEITNNKDICSQSCCSIIQVRRFRYCSLCKMFLLLSVWPLLVH